MATPIPTPDITSGLVAYWKMDETSWGTVSDSSGNNNNGTALNGATVTTGKFGNGGSFDGSNDYIQIPDNSNLNFVALPYTISVWVNKYSDSGIHFRRLLDKTISGQPNGYGFDMSDTQIRMLGSENYAYSYTVSNNNWYLLTVTSDGSGIGKIYVNGSQVGSGAYRSNNPNTGAARIGMASDSSSFFHGILDEVRLYNRSLSDADVQMLYTYAPGPIAQWKFDDGSGSSLVDSSGNSYTGTWGGTLGTQWTTGKYDGGGSMNDSNNTITISGLGNPGTSNYTMQAWVKTTVKGIILSKRHSTSSGINSLVLSAGTGYSVDSNTAVLFDDGWGYAGHFITGTTNILDNQWHHITGIRNATGLYIYVDGNLEGTRLESPRNVTSSDAWKIGDHGAWTAGGNCVGNCFFGGTIDNVRIYNYTRTPEQILLDMNNL
ncbi:LamG domain-containing protein [Candidatus Dojkabacteria bacterium]|nr:LamG domain-containing protein [Candidatus Dojkabacteria bacterium]